MATTCKPHVPVLEHLTDRAEQLLAVQLTGAAQARTEATLNRLKTRALKVLEITQYTILYFFAAILCAAVIDKVFPEYDANKDSALITIEAMGQLVIIALTMFLLKKLIRMIPFVGYAADCYDPSGEPDGVDVVMGILFSTMQPQLFAKLQHIGRSITIGLSPSSE